MIYPDFVNFTPEQCLNQFVYHIYLEQVECSFFFLKSVPDELFIPKINSLCDTLNTDDASYQFLKGTLFYFISRLSIELENKKNDDSLQSQNCSNLFAIKKPIIPDSFYLPFLEMDKVKSKETIILYQIFTGQSDFFQKNKSTNAKQQNPDNKKPIVQAIAYLFEKHRGLYTALLRHGYMEALLLRVGPEPLFNYFKLNSFSLRDQFDKSYLTYFSPKMVNSTNFGQFWSQCPIIFDSKSSQLFQSLFSCDNPYPYFSTKYFPESDLNNEILSLSNDVLTKRNKSFIDIILIVCRTLIINGLKATKDQECFLMYTKQFPDLRILSFLAEYESIKNDPVFDNVVFQLTNNLKSDSNSNSISHINPNSIMTEAMERFGNDYQLCFYLTNNIGRKTRTADLEKMSLPNYLIVHANLDVDCSSFCDKKMFVINDNDRKNDFVFIYLYQALCLIVNQIHNLKKNESQIDFSEISITDSLSEISLSSTEMNQTFSDKLAVLIEYIKSMTTEESFEKVMIELFSVIFITEKVGRLNDSENEVVNFVFTDDQITEIVSILFHFCPKQKEIRRAFLKFKFIRTLSQKKFEEAKNLAENENDSFYRLALIAELISKISNSEQWSFPSCIDKSFFDAEYLLSNNEDFGANMTNICPELTILVANRRNFKKVKKYMPYELYDIENTRKNIKAFKSHDYEQIEKDHRCIQFNDFIDFESKLDSSGNKNLNNLDDIISFEIKNDKVSSLLTLKTVPEEYKDNKFINAIFERTTNSNKKEEPIDLNKEIQSVDDISNYLKKCDEKLLFIEDNDIQFLLTKSFAFNPIPYEILNDLYIRNEKVTTSFYKSLINKLKIIDFIQMMPFCFYKSLSKYSKKSNLNLNQNLLEFLEYLVINKKFMNAKQFAEDFHLTIQLELIIKRNISEMDYQTIESTFPQLKEFIEKKRKESELKQYKPTETEIHIMNQLHHFINFDNEEDDDEDDEYENLPTFFNLFPIFQSIKKNLEIVSSSLMTQIVEIVTKLLEKSCIDSIEAEMNATIIFPHLLNFMKLFKLRMLNLSESSNYQSFLYQLECISKLVCCCFNSTFREVYNFNNFFSKQQGASYASLCQKYDRIGILRDIQTYWSLTEYRFFDSVLNCFKLGLLKSGNIELKEAVKAHQALKIDCQSLASELIPILSFVKPFAVSSYKEKIAELSELKKSKIDITKLIEKNEGIEIKSFHFSSKKSDKSEEEFPIIHITSPQIISLDESLTIISACEDQILFHCQFGDFEDAFKLFSRFYLNNNNSMNSGVNNGTAMSVNAFRLSVFMRVLITPAIAFKQWNFFCRRLVRYLNTYEKVIDEFLNFSGQNKMYFILFDIQKRLEYNDNALLAAVKMFEKTDSWKKQQEILNMMNLLIQKSLKLNTPEDKKKHKSFFSVDSLFQLQRRTNVQLAIISMFINTKVPFDKNLELMTSKENTINLASFLLLRLQIGYFSEICELPDISMDEICENAIEILNSSSKREEGSISGFFKNLTMLETGTYRKLIMCLSKSIYRRVPDEKSFVEFVTRNIKGDDLIAAVLQSFGFESEADEILKRKSHK